MDKRTIDQYESRASYYVNEYENVVPHNLHSLIIRYFKKGEPTADIGCGSGRDANFMKEKGFPVVGYDASFAMLDEAKKLYSDIPMFQAILPELEEIPDNIYTNILCSSVLMHLPSDKLEDACDNILRITVPGGIVLLSIRSSRDQVSREQDGRLYTKISGSALVRYFEQIGAQLVYRDEVLDETRPDMHWYTFIFEKNELVI